MQSSGRTISKISKTLCIFLMLTLVLALGTSHIGMGAQPQGQSMSMTHAGQTQDQADNTGPKHSKMSDSLCATLCLGTDRLDGGVVVGRVEKFVVTTWLVEIDPAWTSPIPDPALRPPDTLLLT